MNGGDRRLGIYAGSFDPPTLGHLDIVERARSLVDELVVVIGHNPHKEGWLPVDERLAALRECLNGFDNVRVEIFEGLLVDCARRLGSRILIRGLRAVSDYEYEFRMAMANRRMAPEVETIFLNTREEYSFLASSVVREIAEFGGDYHAFVPEPVAVRIERRLSATRSR